MGHQFQVEERATDKIIKDEKFRALTLILGLFFSSLELIRRFVTAGSVRKAVSLPLGLQLLTA